MDLIASIIGIFAICFLLLYVIFGLDPEHFLLKLLLFFVFLVCLPLIPKVLIAETNYCEMLLNNTVENTSVVNTTTTTYQYTRHCHTNTDQTYNTLLGVTLWVWRFCILYMLLYLTWHALKFSGVVVPANKSKMGWRIRK